jgi:hypothetical protein
MLASYLGAMKPNKKSSSAIVNSLTKNHTRRVLDRSLTNNKMPTNNAMPMAADSAEISGALVTGLWLKPKPGLLVRPILGLCVKPTVDMDLKVVVIPEKVGLFSGAACKFIEINKPNVTANNINFAFIIVLPLCLKMFTKIRVVTHCISLKKSRKQHERNPLTAQ